MRVPPLLRDHHLIQAYPRVEALADRLIDLPLSVDTNTQIQAFVDAVINHPETLAGLKVVSEEFRREILRRQDAMCMLAGDAQDVGNGPIMAILRQISDQVAEGNRKLSELGAKLESVEQTRLNTARHHGGTALVVPTRLGRPLPDGIPLPDSADAIKRMSTGHLKRWYEYYTGQDPATIDRRALVASVRSCVGLPDV